MPACTSDDAANVRDITTVQASSLCVPGSVSVCVCGGGGLIYIVEVLERMLTLAASRLSMMALQEKDRMGGRWMEGHRDRKGVPCTHVKLLHAAGMKVYYQLTRAPPHLAGVSEGGDLHIWHLHRAPPPPVLTCGKWSSFTCSRNANKRRMRVRTRAPHHFGL